MIVRDYYSALMIVNFGSMVSEVVKMQPSTITFGIHQAIFDIFRRIRTNTNTWMYLKMGYHVWHFSWETNDKSIYLVGPIRFQLSTIQMKFIHYDVGCSFIIHRY